MPLNENAPPRSAPRTKDACKKELIRLGLCLPTQELKLAEYQTMWKEQTFKAAASAPAPSQRSRASDAYRGKLDLLEARAMALGTAPVPLSMQAALADKAMPLSSRAQRPVLQHKSPEQSLALAQQQQQQQQRQKQQQQQQFEHEEQQFYHEEQHARAFAREERRASPSPVGYRSSLPSYRPREQTLAEQRAFREQQEEQQQYARPAPREQLDSDSLRQECAAQRPADAREEPPAASQRQKFASNDRDASGGQRTSRWAWCSVVLGVLC
ncbi:hypothetical protein T492DRAFT_876938, partial [Pavlovales sp. CCMP2436]